ncbi:ExbD/TolR family protein [Paucihalobacter sp.]|uniref:ExbD/TolR family protein n=1 Tax=Paucihalobacter sp. TaxID=2850405 RepID=UPI002FE30DDD
MKTFRRTVNAVNAGSMADIAFLLLIFFLVTTTISTDKGIMRQLPKPCLDNSDCTSFREERNTLSIILNANNELMVNHKKTELQQLKQLIIDFVDNNGGGNCNYCSGNRTLESSEHPKKAYIGLQTNRSSNYKSFIAVQDEITQAYYEMRLKYAENKFDTPLNALSSYDLRTVQEAYPFNLIELNQKQ